MIKLTNIISETIPHVHGIGDIERKQGMDSQRRFNLTSPRVKKLISGPFSHSAARFLYPNDEKYSLYRVTYPRMRYSQLVEYELIIPKKIERVSLDSSNLYTVLMSNLPSWKGWPRRSFSILFFVTTSHFMPFPESDKSHYGSHIYDVLPENDAKICVAPTDDVLDNGHFSHMGSVLNTSKDSIDSIPLLAGFLKTIIETGLLAKEKSTNARHTDITNVTERLMNCNYSDYKNVVKTLDVLWNEKTKNSIMRFVDSSNVGGSLYKPEDYNVIFEKVNSSGGWENLLDDALNPEKNGFQLMTTENIRSISTKESEAWTESPCILHYKDEFY